MVVGAALTDGSTIVVPEGTGAEEMPVDMVVGAADAEGVAEEVGHRGAVLSIFETTQDDEASV